MQSQILSSLQALQTTQKELMERSAQLTAKKDHGNKADDTGIIQFQSDVANLTPKIQDLLQRVEMLEKQHDDLEQYSRRNCVILHGCTSMPESDDYYDFENYVITTLNNKLKLDRPIVNMDIDITHKLKSKSPKNPIIIKFVRRSTKNLIYNKKTKLKGSGLSITESLTRSRLKLLAAAKQAFGKEKVSTMNGIIYAYLDKRRVISSLNDIKLHSR